MRCVNAAVDLGVDAVVAPSRRLDDRVPWCLADVGLTISVDLLGRADGVERERVRTDTNNGACVPRQPGSKRVQSDLRAIRTVSLVLVKLIEVAVAGCRLKNVKPLRQSGQQRTGILGQRM